MLEDVMIVPADNRNPIITNEMKAICIGEFSWQENAPYYDSAGDLIEYTATYTVPWDLCKEIYKRMARVASHYEGN